MADTDRPRWWFGLRGFARFLGAGGLALFAYDELTHRPGGPPWRWLVFGAVVCGVLSALFPRRRRG
ncbi:hypothetical protein [Streptomyces sp. NPDC046805]|uniref:hypothetical protein n=1 Tax=Streptomyces sp. NPDC046805 TaxID=3155134 RepID=UPI00340C17CE